MRIDVAFTPAELAAIDTKHRTVAVIDVLRASTTIAVALEHGAEQIIPLATVEAAVLFARTFPDPRVILAGERHMLPLPGFDLGNSPLTFTRDAVEGQTIALTTTNGTMALTSIQRARSIVVASFVNLSAVCTTLRDALLNGDDVAIVCSGDHRAFSLEDAACAGRYVRTLTRDLPRVTLNDAARTAAILDARYDDAIAVFADSSHAAALAAASFEADLALAATVDVCPVLPVYCDGRITL